MERYWERASGLELRCLSLQLALVTMEILWVLQIPAGREGKVPLSNMTPFIHADIYSNVWLFNG